MYKIFTMAAAISVLPVLQNIPGVAVSVNNKLEEAASIFPYKNTITTYPFEAEKKPAEAWSQNWLAQAQENIRKSEYYFTWQKNIKAYSTPNRKNNFFFVYNDKGFSVEPFATKIPTIDIDPKKSLGNIQYKSTPNWKVKFNLDKKQVSNGTWQITNNKAEYITDKITVQYINNDEGMRQNFIVHQPLLNTNELKINFSINSKLKIRLYNDQLQFFHKKSNVLNYKDLKVWDATGKSLTASFKKSKKGNYCIQVQTKNAVYPITIDPISTSPAAIVESNQAGAQLGFSVASAGDVNGDGYSDVIVGAFAYSNGEMFEGAAFIYHGSPLGISTSFSAMVQSNLAFAFMGYSIASAGDVNGDGYSDVIVGAYAYYNIESDEGAIFVYHGSAAGINTTPAVFIESNLNDAQMGISVACAGDVNGDGYSDVIVGAYSYDNGQFDEGCAFIFHGSATGITSTAVSTLESNQAQANMGFSVSSAGDVNGDGYSDVIVGAIGYANGQGGEGRAFIYHGSAVGINITPAITVESNQISGQMGFSVACAGDVNGDGYSDVIIGANGYDNGETDEGRVYFYHGSASGINSTPAATVESNQPNALMGSSVSCAGDVNGDGYSDVIVGAYLYDNGQTDEGVAYIYHGSSVGVNTAAAATLEFNQANARFGYAVASAGDVNGDGYSDVIVGARQYSNGQINEGGALVYHGSAAGLSSTPTNTPDDANQTAANFATSVASAGDVNGDGYSDVIIGASLFNDTFTDEGVAYVYHGSATGLPASPTSVLNDADLIGANFGSSVAGAGDVNGDGYSDVIVGAVSYKVGANNIAGKAFVYHGSAAGIITTAAITFNDGNQAIARFGVSVASAGDVNGDGYSDVIIGCQQFDDTFTDEGVAFVYHGSATGLSATYNSLLDDADQASSFFGNSVASAGDVNGDGFSDVIVGAVAFDDGPNNSEGRAFIYHGSVTGLLASPASILDDADQPSAQFGQSVASAGDVNGDGYSDVIVGAHSYDDGANANEGRAFVYYGSAAGVSASPNSTPDDCNQANALFSYSVACAGDVNGDGYSDVIIGAINASSGFASEGGAYLYYGSATGLAASSATTLDDANQTTANLGTSVSSAGDINGDGYSDVISGAPKFDDVASTDEGVAFVYMGNDLPTNKRNNLRLYNTDLTTPINSSNFLFSNFGAGLYAKSFLGRAKGKLVWETRINYNAYSGTPITNSTFFTAQQTSYTDMGSAGIELKDIISKISGGRYTKLRARVKYDPVTAITGQVYSPWRNISSIIDANNLGILPIELISFNAAWQQKGKTARLDFKTDKESGICCFDIEKSSDGFNFYFIGSLPAKNISGIQSYSFVDVNAAGKNQFYRIKIKGIAGQIDYSNIQQLSNDKASEILVFPNPTTAVLQLQLNKAFDKIDVQVFNSYGQLVKQLNVPASNQIIKIPVQNLAAGKYWLHLQSAGEKQVLQFIKQ